MLFRAAITAILLTFLVSLLPIISEARKDTRVKSQVRKDYRPVQPHKRKSHNSTKLDNYGTKGNLNPHTCMIGKDDLFDGNGER